jgi:hypothetical protein
MPVIVRLLVVYCDTMINESATSNTDIRIFSLANVARFRKGLLG